MIIINYIIIKNLCEKGYFTNPLMQTQFSVSVEGALTHSEDQPEEPLWVILATATSVKFNCQSTTWSGSISMRISRFQASLNVILYDSWIMCIYIYHHIIFKDRCMIYTYITIYFLYIYICAHVIICSFISIRNERLFKWHICWIPTPKHTDLHLPRRCEAAGRATACKASRFGFVCWDE